MLLTRLFLISCFIFISGCQKQRNPDASPCFYLQQKIFNPSNTMTYTRVHDTDPIPAQQLLDYREYQKKGCPT